MTKSTPNDDEQEHEDHLHGEEQKQKEDDMQLGEAEMRALEEMTEQAAMNRHGTGKPQQRPYLMEEFSDDDDDKDFEFSQLDGADDIPQLDGTDDKHMMGNNTPGRQVLVMKDGKLMTADVVDRRRYSRGAQAASGHHEELSSFYRWWYWRYRR